MEVDIKLVLTVAGMLASVVAASAVARQQIKVLLEQVQDQEQRMREADSRSDRLENKLEVQSQRVDVLSKMSDPQLLAAGNRELSRFEVLIAVLRDEVSGLKKMHNGAHPNVTGR